MRAIVPWDVLSYVPGSIEWKGGFFSWDYFFRNLDRADNKNETPFPPKRRLSTFQPGLPDGILSNQKSHLGKFWRALELVYIFYAHLVYFTAKW
jgi:hypothetical protein